LDRYDIAANTWNSGLAYGNQGETFNTGSSFEYNGDSLYINVSGTGRFLEFKFIPNRLEPLSGLSYPQSTAVVGDKLFCATYVDGATKQKFLYALRNTGSELFRLMIY
jgi:hypothetical protein